MHHGCDPRTGNEFSPGHITGITDESETVFIHRRGVMAAFADEVLQRNMLLSGQQGDDLLTIEKTLHVSLA